MDSPRPAGRRWARLRRSGSRATAVLTRRRRRESALSGTQVVFPPPERSWRRRRSATDNALAAAGRAPIAAAELAPMPAAGPVPGPADPRTPDVVHLRAVGPVSIPLLPGERTPVRRLKFALANGCTIASLLLGMSAAFLAIAGEFRLAAITLLACVAFDGFDGGLARRFGVCSPFGAQLDSMADLSSFGVATGVVVYEWLLDRGASPALAGPACALVAVCAAVRLARFNVSPKDGRFFSGVPTTMTAAVLALDILLGPHLPADVQVVAVAVYALAMVTSFPYVKLGQVLRLPMWLWVLPAICAMITVPWTFTAIVGGYLVTGPLLWLYHTRRPVELIAS